MSKLESGNRRKPSAPLRPSDKSGMTAQEQQARSRQQDPGVTQVEASPPEVSLPAPRRVQSQQRELRVTVWEEETGALPDPGIRAAEQLSPQTSPDMSSERVEVVEDEPTRPLEAVHSSQERVSQTQHRSKDDAQAASPETEMKGSALSSAVDDLPTSPLVAAPPPRMSPVRPAPASGENGNRVDDVEQVLTRPMPSQRISAPLSVPRRPVSEPRLPQPAPRQVMQPPVTPVVPVSQPGFLAPSPVVSPAAPTQMPPATRERGRRGGKRRLFVIVTLLLVLLAAGVATWIVVVKPFNVPDITNATVAYQNSSLRFALRYPQGWLAQPSSHSVSFADANATDQVNVLMEASNGQSVDQYLKKEEAQLGMTGQKNLPVLTFAGATWQEVQGTVLQSGATDTVTLLVTPRGGNFYALVLMAPATTYANADRYFFAGIRSSFQFL